MLFGKPFVFKSQQRFVFASLFEGKRDKRVDAWLPVKHPPRLHDSLGGNGFDRSACDHVIKTGEVTTGHGFDRGFRTRRLAEQIAVEQDFKQALGRSVEGDLLLDGVWQRLFLRSLFWGRAARLVETPFLTTQSRDRQESNSGPLSRLSVAAPCRFLAT